MSEPDNPTGNKSTTRPSQLRRVVMRSVGGGLNLSVAGSALLAAAALHSLPVLALGLVSYAALVAWDVTNPGFIRKTLDGSGGADPPPLPDPARLKDPAVRRALEGLLKARAELARVLLDTPEDVRSHVDIALASIPDLEQRAGRLATRAEGLSTYLATVDLAQVQADVGRLDGAARRSGDADARREYETARQAREEHLHAVTDVAAARDRIIARLESIAATLEGLPAKIVRMRALDAQAMDSLSGDIAGELSEFNRDIRSFEETLKTLEEVKGP